MMVGIIKWGEVIFPTTLTSSIRAYDYTKQQLKTKQMKYQKLHDLFKKGLEDDIFIKINNLLRNSLAYRLNEVLIMEGGNVSRGAYLYRNSKFEIFFSSYNYTITKIQGIDKKNIHHINQISTLMF